MRTIFVIARVDNKASPLLPKLNIDVSNLPAVAKSAARKKTHVTFIKKNMTRAMAKFDEGMDFKKRGAMIPFTA